MFVDLQNDLRPCATHKSTVQFYDVGTGLSELNHPWLLPLLWRALQGRIQDFFRRGCTRLLLYFNTNKPHSFFCRIPVVLQNRRSSQGGRGGGGVRSPCTLPQNAPLLYTAIYIYIQLLYSSYPALQTLYTTIYILYTPYIEPIYTLYRPIYTSYLALYTLDKPI